MKTHWNNCAECQGDYYEINALFIINFCLDKDSFSLDTFWTQFVYTKLFLIWKF